MIGTRSGRAGQITLERYEPDFGGGAKATESLAFPRVRRGQGYPQQCPYLEGTTPAVACADPLGEPMGIGDVAALLGCSVWTVRQRLLPSGLPHFRIGSAGKLMFYRNQIVRWVLEKQQQKGGGN